jgi:hypothetical protein
VEQFLSSFRRDGLLTPDTAARVLRYFDEHPGDMKHGELSMRLALTHPQVVAMLRVGDGESVLRGVTERAAAAELAQAYGELKDESWARAFLQGLNGVGVSGDWPVVIRAMTPAVSSRVLGPINGPEDLLRLGFSGFAGERDLASALIELENLHKACVAMGDMLCALREIYELGVAQPGAALTAQQVQELAGRIDAEQERVRASLVFWFSAWLQGPESLFRVFLDDRLRPYTAAFLRSLVHLAGAGGAGTDLVAPVLLLERDGAGDAVSFGV